MGQINQWNLPPNVANKVIGWSPNGKEMVNVDVPLATAPILIFASGQSNMARQEDFDWTPPANLMLWNHDPTVDVATHVGTAFEAVPSDKISTSWSFGAEVALANPGHTVYIVNTSQGGQAIAQWLVGAPDPDLYATGKANIEAALAVIGEPVKLIHLWWQGESDAIADSTTYETDFATYHVRLATETWWSLSTPIVIFGVSIQMGGTSGPKLRSFNKTLAAVAARSPEKLHYIHSGEIGKTRGWLATGDYIHMTAEGYDQVGRLAYHGVYGGVGRANLQSMVVDPETKQLIQPLMYAFNAVKLGPLGVESLADYETPAFDTTAGAFDPVTGIFTVPLSGLWCVDVFLVTASSGTCQTHLNGTNLGNGSQVQLSVSGSGLGGITYPFVKGDELQLVVTAGTPSSARFSARFVG